MGKVGLSQPFQEALGRIQLKTGEETMKVVIDSDGDSSIHSYVIENNIHLEDNSLTT